MRLERLCLVCTIVGCFSPEDPAPSGNTETDSGTSVGNTDAPVTDSAVTSVSNTSPSSTATPSTTDAPTTEGPSTDTTPPETESESDTEPDATTTGGGIVVECGDGVPAATEFCFDDPPLVYAVDREPVSIAVGDMTQNGMLDIVTLNHGVDNTSGTVQVLEADGVGGFLLATTLNEPDRGSRVRVLDADGDGDDDIFALGVSGFVHHRNNAGFFASVPQPNFGGEFSVMELIVADLDGDDVLDALNSEAYGHGYFPGILSGGNWTPDPDNRVGLSSIGEGAAGMIAGAFSFDGDNDVDIVALNQYYSDVEVLTNDGSGGFAVVGTVQICAEGGFDGVRYGDWGDFDGDGNDDLVATCTDGDVSVALDDGTGTFPTLVTLALAGTHQVTVADLNGDDNDDLLVTSNAVDRAVAFLGDGDGGFELGETQFMGGGPVYGAAAADLNDDGAMDVIIGYDDGASGQIEVYLATP